MPSPHLLIVDDVPEIVEEMTEMLALRGLVATGAGTIEDAIERLAAMPDIRIVISDVRVHHDSGYAIVGRIADHAALRDRALSYIFMTGDLDAARQAPVGNDSIVLLKPLELRPLIERIEKLLDDR